MEMEKISPNALNVWNYNSIIGIGIYLALILGVYFILPIFINKPIVTICIIAVILILLIFELLNILKISKVKLNSWYFSISEKMIIIKKGIFIKKVIYIPMSRVQHVNTSQGPLMKKYNLREIIINTAGGTHSIPCIEGEKALFIQETIAGYAEGSSEENGL